MTLRLCSIYYIRTCIFISDWIWNLHLRLTNSKFGACDISSLAVSSILIPPASPRAAQLLGSSLPVPPRGLTKGPGRCGEASQGCGPAFRPGPTAAQRGLYWSNSPLPHKHDLAPQCHHVGPQHHWHPWRGGWGGSRGRCWNRRREREGGSWKPTLSVFSICATLGRAAANSVWEQQVGVSKTDTVILISMWGSEAKRESSSI